MQIVFAKTVKSDEWLLCIGPRHLPGFMGKLLGRKRSALATDVFDLAQDIHRILKSKTCVAEARWRWDGDPEDRPSTSEPTGP
jgi:hypothetical protein